MIHRISSGPRVLLLSSLGLWAVACPEGASLDNALTHHEAHRGEGHSGTGCDARPIFGERCAGGICHSEGGEEGPLGGVDLLLPGVEGRLLGMPATYKNVSNRADCPDTPELLIDPSNPERSLLLTKVLNTHACGDGMPVPNPPGLSDTETECIREWIGAVIADGSPTGSGGAPGAGGTDGAAGATNSSTGGTPMTGQDPRRIQAECAFGAASGDCDGTTGSSMGNGTTDPALEADDTAVGYFDEGSWLSFTGIDLSGFTHLSFSYSKEAGAGSIEVRLDSASGTLIGTFTPTPTGDWATYGEASISLTPTTGTHNVFLVAAGSTGVANLDWIEFFVQ